MHNLQAVERQDAVSIICLGVVMHASQVSTCEVAVWVIHWHKNEPQALHGKVSGHVAEAQSCSWHHARRLSCLIIRQAAG